MGATDDDFEEASHTSLKSRTKESDDQTISQFPLVVSLGHILRAYVLSPTAMLVNFVIGSFSTAWRIRLVMTREPRYDRTPCSAPGVHRVNLVFQSVTWLVGKGAKSRFAFKTHLLEQWDCKLMSEVMAGPDWRMASGKKFPRCQYNVVHLLLEKIVPGCCPQG